MLTVPAGRFFEDHRRAGRFHRTRRQWIGTGSVLAVAAVAPLMIGVSWTSTAVVALIYVVAVVGLQLVTGVAGQAQLGQAAFMGFGAYTAAALARASVPMPLVLVGAGAGTAMFGCVFGLAAGRIRGFYLAVSSIAAQYLFVFLIANMPSSIFGGSALGISVQPASIFGFDIVSDRRSFYFCLVVAVLAIAGAYRITRSRLGRTFVAVRDDELAAGLTGVNVFKVKVVAFAVSAGYAGVGGALWAYYFRHVDTEQFTLFLSVWFLGMLIVGGLGSIGGAVVGTLLVRTLERLISLYGPDVAELLGMNSATVVYPMTNVLLGSLIVLFLIFEPRGLVRRWRSWVATARTWPFPY